jgi:hypothetical protein
MQNKKPLVLKGLVVHREAIVSLWVMLSPLVEIAGHYLRAGGRNSLKAAKRTNDAGAQCYAIILHGNMTTGGRDPC